MNRRRRTEAELQRECNRFNEWNKVGTAVTVTLDNGSEIHSTTTTPAQVLGGHSAVIWVADGRSCYLLDRVKLRQPTA